MFSSFRFIELEGRFLSLRGKRIKLTFTRSSTCNIILFSSGIFKNCVTDLRFRQQSLTLNQKTTPRAFRGFVQLFLKTVFSPKQNLRSKNNSRSFHLYRNVQDFHFLMQNKIYVYAAFSSSFKKRTPCIGEASG